MKVKNNVVYIFFFQKIVTINYILILIEWDIDFDLLKKGIPYFLFDEYFLFSGLVYNENIT